MNNILVSVCVVTYNHANFIKKCLDNILMQEVNFSYEILLGEDASNDGTREICKEYARKHPNKIRLFLRSRKDVIYYNDKPTGRYNFIQTMKEAKGKYVALCEGDDYWTNPLKLQKQIDFLNANSAYSLCYHRVRGLYPNQKEKPTACAFLENTTITKTDLYRNNIIPTCSVVYRNHGQFIDEFAQLPFGDWPLHLQSLRLGKGYYMHETMGVYSIHHNGYWSQEGELYKIQQFISVYDIFKKNFTSNKREVKLFNQAFAKMYAYLVITKLKERDIKKVWFYTRESTKKMGFTPLFLKILEIMRRRYLNLF